MVFNLSGVPIDIKFWYTFLEINDDVVYFN